MASKTVIVGPSVGLHARPAKLIAEAAREFDADVWISLPGEEPVDAGSALMIMTLGAEQGSSVVVSSEDAAAVDTLASMIESALDD